MEIWGAIALVILIGVAILFRLCLWYCIQGSTKIPNIDEITETHEQTILHSLDSNTRRPSNRRQCEEISLSTPVPPTGISEFNRDVHLQHIHGPLRYGEILVNDVNSEQNTRDNSISDTRYARFFYTPSSETTVNFHPSTHRGRNIEIRPQRPISSLNYLSRYSETRTSIPSERCPTHFIIHTEPKHFWTPAFLNTFSRNPPFSERISRSRPESPNSDHPTESSSLSNLLTDHNINISSRCLSDSTLNNTQIISQSSRPFQNNRHNSPPGVHVNQIDPNIPIFIETITPPPDYISAEHMIVQLEYIEQPPSYEEACKSESNNCV